MKFVNYSMLALIVLKILEALHPYRHCDALYYHLPFGKFFSIVGLRAAHTEVCGAAQTGIFDYLYGLIYWLLPPILPEKLLWAQQLSQLLHALVSLGIGAGLTWWFLRQQHRIGAFLASASLLLLNKGADFFLFAKNDGVVAMLGFAASLLLFERKLLSRRDWIFFTLVTGTIPLVKLSGLLVLVPLNLFLLVLHRHQLRKVPWVFMGQLLMFSPLLWRNYFFTGNPFFPAFLTWIPGNGPPSIIAPYQAMLSAPVTWQSLQDNLSFFFLGKVIFLATMPLAIWNWRCHRRQDNYYFWLSLSIFNLYLLKNGGVSAERFIFTCYFLNNFFVFKSLINLAVALSSSPSWTQRRMRWAWICIFVLVLADSKLDQKIRRATNLLWRYPRMSYQEAIQFFLPRHQIWDTIGGENPQQLTKIISDDFNEFYYAGENVRLYPSNCLNQGYGLERCTPADLAEIRREYQFGVLRYEKDNACYRYIRQEGEKIHSGHGYDYYRLPQKKE